eukprot:2384573-Lingulodinium_polyedra.AAC.1
MHDPRPGMGPVASAVAGHPTTSGHLRCLATPPPAGRSFRHAGRAHRCVLRPRILSFLHRGGLSGQLCGHIVLE